MAAALTLAYEPGTIALWIVLLAWLACWLFGVVDIFRRRDMGAGAKVLWILVLLLLPFIGLFVYFLFSARPTTS